MQSKKLMIFTLLTVCSLMLIVAVMNRTPVVADDATTRIEVVTIEEGGDTVHGHPIVTAVPPADKPVEQVRFLAKAFHEEDFYPYAPVFSEPYSWTWPTGAPHVPDGKYVLRMEITYASGEFEIVDRNIFVRNDDEPYVPEAPEHVQVDLDEDGRLILSWEPSTSDRLYEYSILLDGEEIGTTTALTYEIEDLTPGETYMFRVKARDIYNNDSLDDNTIGVTMPGEDEHLQSLPGISSIHGPDPNGATEGSEGYSGVIELYVEGDASVAGVEFFVKMLGDPESAYWQFPNVHREDDRHTVVWDTTSAPDGMAIIKATAYDTNGQSRTVTKTFLVDNVPEFIPPPEWEPADKPPENRIVGYLMGDSTYGSFDILRDVDASRLTHLNYAFGYISDDFQVYVNDLEHEKQNFADLITLKERYPHLKTLISIGGWGGSGNFSEAAATEENRRTFAESAVAFITEHGFDGVDLDWEYPVTGGGPGTEPNPADYDNFPLLLETVRAHLDEQGERDGKHYLLTIAGAGNPTYVDNTQIGETHEFLDYVQVMTYDIHGTWEALADFNAPLYDDGGITWSVDRAIQAYLDAGVPAEKIVMGVPFYGDLYYVTSSENNGLRQPFTVGRSLTYQTIVRDYLSNSDFVRYWDEGTQVPYLFNEEELIFISYDDEESIGLKGQYVRDNGLGGAMIWQLAQDNQIDLLAALYQGMEIDESTPGDPGDDEDPGEDPGDGDPTDPPKESALWHAGVGEPANDLGTIGDFYVEEKKGDIYRKTEDGWTWEGNLIQDDLIAGSAVLTGKGAPDPTLGNDDDLYLDLNSGIVSVKFAESDGWESIAVIEGFPEEGEDPDDESERDERDDEDEQNETERNGESDDRDSTSPPSREEGDRLPDTATNHPLFIAIGLSLILISSVLFLIRKKRLQKR